VSEHNQRRSEWAQLFRIARSLIDQANAETTFISHWTFGGGTAMMIQIDHRESHDVDIFVSDPQFLQFLNPETQDFEFEIMPSAYEGDGSRFRKFSFLGIGEIDFIAVPNLTNSPTIEMELEGSPILLETVPEIIAKKVYYRGGSIKPRDIFDIAAASRICKEKLVEALRHFPAETNQALAALEKLNPKFVVGANSELMIKDGFIGLLDSALDDARCLLSEVCK
jgi:hypothetical protein